MAQVKQVNQLTKSDFNKSVAHNLIKRGFFTYAEYNKILSGGADNKFKLSESTIDNVNRFITDKKLKTESLILFIRESAVIFMLDTSNKIIYKFNSNVFYADKFIADNNDWRAVVVDNINDLKINRATNVDTIGASYGFNIK